MNPVALARWQWSDYASGHASRRNLLIHIVAVPAFLLGNLLFLAATIVGIAWFPEFGFLPGALVLALLGLLLSAAAMAAQGNGHKEETQQPHPFTGPLNVLGRIFLEQWFTFPRFVLTGGCARALRAA